VVCSLKELQRTGGHTAFVPVGQSVLAGSNAKLEAGGFCCSKVLLTAHVPVLMAMTAFSWGEDARTLHCSVACCCLRRKRTVASIVQR